MEQKMDELETSRLLLRQFTINDLADLGSIFSDPDVMRFLGKDCLPMSLEETEVALKSMIQHWHRHGFGRWAVVDSASGRLIGYAGIRSLDGRAELVYLLAKEYWGKGLATEIAKNCLKYAIEAKGFDEVVALTRPLNSKSRRVMEKIGMHYVRDANYFGIDVVEYAISAMGYKALSREKDRGIRELDG